MIDKNSYKAFLKCIKCEAENTQLASFLWYGVCRLHLAVDPNSLTVEAALLGKSKEVLHLTALDIDLGEVVHLFGAYLKYEVMLVVRSTCTVPPSSSVSVFAIMMAAQRHVMSEIAR